jgi:hypothetical protein
MVVAEEMSILMHVVCAIGPWAYHNIFVRFFKWLEFQCTLN